MAYTLAPHRFPSVIPSVDGNRSDDNTSATAFPEYAAAQAVWRVGSPIVLVVGTVGSLLSILVLTRRRMRHITTMFYLTVLAVADLAVLYTGLLRLWLDNVFGVYLRLQSDVACKLHTFLVYFTLGFSVWVLVAVTADRCLYVSAPFTAKRWCTLRQARVVVGVIGVVLVLVNMHYLWTVSILFHASQSGIAGDGSFSCYTSRDSKTAFFVEKVWPWIDLCVVCLVPFVIMVVCNSLIVRQLVLSARNLQRHADMEMVVDTPVKTRTPHSVTEENSGGIETKEKEWGEAYTAAEDTGSGRATNKDALAESYTSDAGQENGESTITTPDRHHHHDERDGKVLCATSDNAASTHTSPVDGRGPLVAGRNKSVLTSPSSGPVQRCTVVQPADAAFQAPNIWSRSGTKQAAVGGDDNNSRQVSSDFCDPKEFLHIYLVHLPRQTHSDLGGATMDLRQPHTETAVDLRQTHTVLSSETDTGLRQTHTDLSSETDMGLRQTHTDLSGETDTDRVQTHTVFGERATDVGQTHTDLSGETDTDLVHTHPDLGERAMDLGQTHSVAATFGETTTDFGQRHTDLCGQTASDTGQTRIHLAGETITNSDDVPNTNPSTTTKKQLEEISTSSSSTNKNETCVIHQQLMNVSPVPSLSRRNHTCRKEQGGEVHHCVGDREQTWRQCHRCCPGDLNQRRKERRGGTGKGRKEQSGQLQEDGMTKEERKVRKVEEEEEAGGVGEENGGGRGGEGKQQPQRKQQHSNSEGATREDQAQQKQNQLKDQTPHTHPPAPHHPHRRSGRSLHHPRPRYVSQSSSQRHGRRQCWGIPSVTVMLLSVNCLFWVLTAPVVVFVIGHAYWSPEASAREEAELALGWSLVNVLQYTNNAVHFLLYCLTGPKFRRELAHMCGRPSKRTAKVHSSA